MTPKMIAGLPVPEHAHISTGVSKLGVNIPSFSLPAVLTCRADAPCVKSCYACKGRWMFGHNQELLQGNLLLWNANPKQVEEDIVHTAYFSKFFRWFSSGDIVNTAFFAMMINVANRLPGTRFLCFTKKYELVNQWVNEHGELPANLNVVFSSWGPEFQPENPHHLPVSYVRFKKRDSGEIPVTAFQCSGYCGTCAQGSLSCWTLAKGQSVVFNEH